MEEENDNMGENLDVGFRSELAYKKNRARMNTWAF